MLVRGRVSWNTLLAILWKPVIQRSLPKDHHKSCLDREIPEGRKVLCSGPQPGAIVSRRGKFATMLEWEPRGLFTWAGAQMAPVSRIWWRVPPPPQESGSGLSDGAAEWPLSHVDSYNPQPELLCLIQRQASLSDILSQTLVKTKGVADSHFFQSSLLHPFSLVRLADQSGSTPPPPQMVERWADHQTHKLFLLWNQSARFCQDPPRVGHSALC